VLPAVFAYGAIWNNGCNHTFIACGTLEQLAEVWVQVTGLDLQRYEVLEIIPSKKQERPSTRKGERQARHRFHGGREQLVLCATIRNKVVIARPKVSHCPSPYSTYVSGTECPYSLRF
jgi:hypothetical protein